jgi:UDP-N-acetylglucosamine--N-acetylmuramyl-(pentapeptide) pyrophosphoryl-undecaprenol N-acetylglucosamine transferase
MERKRVFITGGGSGGHLWPMFVVAKKLQKKYEIIILSDRNLKNEQIFKNEKFRSYKILSGKINRFHTFSAYYKNFLNLILFAFGLIQSLIILLFLRPSLIFSKGGYAALPISFTAHLLKIPTIIHESDLALGLTNRLSLKNASKIAVSFPPENYNLPLDKIAYTGHILRPEIFLTDTGHIRDTRNKLELNQKLPIILITGGSQGSLALNKIVARSINQLLSFSNIIHISGIRDYHWLKESVVKNNGPGKYFLEGYTSDMIDYLKISDLIITRAGSNTLAEIAALKKPAIIIPYQYASANHQYKNAQYFSKNSAGILIEEENLNHGFLIKTIKELLSDKEKLQLLGDNAYRINLFNGVENLERLISQILDGKEKK